ncbi:CBO0543 family protein [Pelotomaculum propionicicum]|uniref:Uncharacterized protein n=1 Tax=Pelotomaculum propionicicum TaxID=258475 RepID=A0A4Y7RSR6_9FIRM|nr:CBO0543 family protein [Pelotomaculum propionicicum]TEB11790.1 hypothetical protein Pmgp_01368 [Pelotomaculum propionicicum]
MNISVEPVISLTAFLLALLLLIFAVDWRYFRDWIVIFLYKSLLDSLWGSAVVNAGRIEFPFRQLPQLFKMGLLFDYWVFPILCVWYNHITRERGLWQIFFYAVLFSAGMTAIEFPLELYTNLIKYIKWDWFTTFYTLTITFLSSRAFIAFYRWGCDYFGRTKP